MYNCSEDWASSLRLSNAAERKVGQNEREREREREKKKHQRTQKKVDRQGWWISRLQHEYW